MNVGTRERTKPTAAELRELALRAQQGDKEAASELSVAVYPEVYHFARYCVKGNPTIEADDIVQDTYYQMLISLHEYRGGNFKSWLFTIIRNKTINKMKGGISRLETELDKAIELLTDESDGPEQRSLDRQRDEKLREVMAAVLTDRQRKMMEFYHDRHKSIREIAVIMNVSDSTVKNTLSQAREKLEREFSKEYDKKDIFNGIMVMPLLSSMLRQDIAGGLVEIPSFVLEATTAGAVTAATAGSTAAASSGAAGTAATGTGIAAKFAALGVAAKAAIVTASAAVVVTGVTVPVLVHNQRQAEQAALILQQEQEAEESRIAFEAEQSRIAEEARIAEESRAAEEARIAEESRIAAEAEAGRIAEEERIAAEQAEAERIAEEEAAAASQTAAAAAAQSEAAAASQSSQPQGGGGGTNQPSSPGRTPGGAVIIDEDRDISQEPAEGPPAGLNNPKWDPERGGWVGTNSSGDRILVRPNGSIRFLD